MAYRSFDEAIALANDSDYGLGANLYSNDPRKIKQYYEEVKAGTCWVNDPLTDNDAGPFGGMKSAAARASWARRGWRNFWRPSTCIGILRGKEELVVSLLSARSPKTHNLILSTVRWLVLCGPTGALGL